MAIMKFRVFNFLLNYVIIFIISRVVLCKNDGKVEFDLYDESTSSGFRDEFQSANSLLIVYDVDNTLLDRHSTGKSTLNPHSIPLLVSLDNRKRDGDMRILNPRIFSHGSGSVQKFREATGEFSRLGESNNYEVRSGDDICSTLQIGDFGRTYFAEGSFFFQASDQQHDHVINVHHLFFTDEGEVKCTSAFMGIYHRILERKSYYSDLSLNLTHHESKLYNFLNSSGQVELQSLKIPNELFPYKLNGPKVSEQAKNLYIRQLFKKVSSLPKVWPSNVCTQEVTIVKDMVRYRRHIIDDLPLRESTITVLVDDLHDHLNFACVNEHMSNENRVLVILVEKFADSSVQNSHRVIPSTPKIMPNPIGSLPPQPFSLREVKNMLQHTLDSVGEDVSSLDLFQALRNQFFFSDPTYPRCNYDVSKPAMFYLIINLECDLMYALLRFFVDQRLMDDLKYIIARVTQFMVLGGKEACGPTLMLIKKLIAAGFHEWLNKVTMMPSFVGGTSTSDVVISDHSDGSLLSKKETSNTSDRRNKKIPDKHTFMAKYFARLPRSRTIVLRLDFMGDPNQVKHVDYTCFIQTKLSNSNINSQSAGKDVRRLLARLPEPKIRIYSLPEHLENKAANAISKLSHLFHSIAEIAAKPKSGLSEPSEYSSYDRSHLSQDVASPFEDSEEPHLAGYEEEIGPAQNTAVASFLQTKMNPRRAQTYPAATTHFAEFFNDMSEKVKNIFSESICIETLDK